MKRLENVTDDIVYIGAYDDDIDLFESQYKVPEGIAYNSYLIKDKSYVIMDTVDVRRKDEWLKNLKDALNGKEPDYLVISHMEPDHASCIGILANMYPNMKLVGSAMTFTFILQFFDIPNLDDRKVIVGEGDTLNIGKNTLRFIMAPMVHWPEVMMTYVENEKLLFSADGFGKFGKAEFDDEWLCEARRYYFNICGKYGDQVQSLLKKASTLDINTICPLHGPVVKDDYVGIFVGKYDIWSRYIAEDKGIVICYASIHGNTKSAMNSFKDMLQEKTADDIVIYDLSRCDMAEAIEDAFRYDRLILASSSYDGGVFTPMQTFVELLKHKNFQNRTVGIVENGTWAPSVIRTIKPILESMKNIKICENTVTIKSTLNDSTKKDLEELADEILS